VQNSAVTAIDFAAADRRRHADVSDLCAGKEALPTVGLVPALNPVYIPSEAAADRLT